MGTGCAVPLSLWTVGSLKPTPAKNQRFRNNAKLALLAGSLAQRHMPDLYLFALPFGSLLLGIYLERWRTLWAKHRWLAKQNFADRKPKGGLLPFQKPRVVSATDPTEQLRAVMAADFEKRRLLSKEEARILYAAERAIDEAKLGWRVMAQVSLGEVLSSPDAQAYSAINSKRVDLLIISRSGVPIAAIEYQGRGHYRGSAAARDAVKKEALRKSGVRYIEVTPEHSSDELAREIQRIAKVEQEKALDGSEPSPSRI